MLKHSQVSFKNILYNKDSNGNNLEEAIVKNVINKILNAIIFLFYHVESDSESSLSDSLESLAADSLIAATFSSISVIDKESGPLFGNSAISFLSLGAIFRNLTPWRINAK